MSKSSKLRKYNFSSYFRELSIVIIGVAVTLYASGLINGIKEQNDLAQHLRLIYTELEDNVSKLDDLMEYYSIHEKYSGFLQKSLDNPDQAIADSLKKYSYTIDLLHPFNYKKGAYEMFLYSGTMKLLNDKNLFLDITECYAMLEVTQNDYKQYEQMKLDEIQKLYDSDIILFRDGLDITAENHRNLYNFFTSVLKIGGGYARVTKEQIEKVLVKKAKGVN